MNPFVVFFKPLFTLFTWIVTGFVAVIMTIGGKFEGRSRDNLTTIIGAVSPAASQRPARIDVKASTGERFHAWFQDAPLAVEIPAAKLLKALGPPPQDAVSTFIALEGDRGGTMTCRLSYDTVAQVPGGVCVLDDKTVYDLYFVDPEKLEDR
jgi:hypothetical protein